MDNLPLDVKLGIGLGLVLVLGVGIAWYLVRRGMNKSAVALLAEFRTRFPGKCAICAYHRWGIQMGFEGESSKPKAHDKCPEGAK